MSNLYKSTYEGKLPTDLATITEGRILMAELQKNAPRFRGGMGLPEASLLAIGSNGGRTALYIPIEELLNNGFSDSQLCHLQLKIEQGPKRSTDDDFGDEYINPFRTTNGVMLEVRDGLDIINKYGDFGLERIFTAISQAASFVAPKAVLASSIVPPAPPAAAPFVEPDPDNHPTHDAPIDPPPAGSGVAKKGK
jgi:hypothetical protein